MSNKNTPATNYTFSTTGLLGVAFVVLKLTRYIDWSWWYVLMPFYLPLGILIAICLVCCLFLGGLAIYERVTSK